MPAEKRAEPWKSPPAVDLGVAGWRVPLHSHIACLFEAQETLAEALGFLTAGLRDSDHCVIVGDDADNQRILGILERQGLGVASFQAGGRLRIVGRGPSRAMLDEVTAAFAAALVAGPRILRLIGIVGWDRERQAPDAELFAFEVMLTGVAERWPCVILCLHEARSASGPAVRHGGLETHPGPRAPQGAPANPYFVPVNSAPERLAAIAAELVRRQREGEALRQRSELLQIIIDNVPVMVSRFDASGRRPLLANREWERVLGWTLEEAQRLDVLAEVYPDLAEQRRALEFVRHGGREPTEFKVRTRSGAVIDTLWTRSVLSDGTTIGFGLDVTERKRTEERLRQSYEELRALAARLRAAREEESVRIAREVHDQVGQMLAALQLDVAWLERRLASPAPPAPPEAPASPPPPLATALAGKLHDMSQLLDLATDAVHRIIGELRPGILDVLGLEAAVEWYVEDFQKRTGIPCRLVSTMAGAMLGPDQATVLFRILQEALSNVARHAGASAVDIRLAAEAGRVTLAIADDGSGIPEEKIGDLRSIGLLGMRERASALAGDVVVRPNPAGGTTVEVILPR
jgi:PAS domain S-box-containing protein